MRIAPYKAQDLMDLQLQPGQLYCSDAINPEYARFLEGEYAYTVFAGDKVVAVAGLAKLWENRALAWAFIDREAGPHFVELTRIVRGFLDVAPYKRIEADTPCDFKQGHRWLRILGFELEAECMRAYRTDGGDSSLYARVR